MKTITHTWQDRKNLFYLSLAGYGIIAIFAILRVLTDISEWWKESKHTANDASI